MHQKTCQVEVTDGRLDIGFTSTSQYPQLWRINAIEIERIQQGAEVLPSRHPDQQEASARNTFHPNENSTDRAPCRCGQ